MQGVVAVHRVLPPSATLYSTRAEANRSERGEETEVKVEVFVCGSFFFLISKRQICLLPNSVFFKEKTKENENEKSKSEKSQKERRKKNKKTKTGVHITVQYSFKASATEDSLQSFSLACGTTSGYLVTGTLRPRQVIY